MSKSRVVAWVATLTGLFLGLDATAATARDDEPVEVIQADREIPEDHLLDVGIRLFDTGIPDDENAKYMLEDKGVYEDVRKSEARWIPILLKRALESSGFWGAVRLVPAANAVDVMIDGAIVESNGKKLEVDVMVFDSTGRSWLSKRYKEEADPLAYEDEKANREPFQDLYNRIANDLLDKRGDIKDEDFLDIRRVTELKFATDLAPTAFESYLEVKKGRYSPAKLPAEDDPMMLRLTQIRDRDYMFIDTLNEYYADLYQKMETPYDSWRSFSYEEQVALDKLNRASRLQKILGAAAIIGGVMASRRGGGWGNAGEVAVLGGMSTIMDSFDKSEQAKMHRQALSELAGSFDSEVSEILVDVEGEVLRLQGSVDTQYASWRDLLRQIFATDMGLPADPNAPVNTRPGTSKQ
jgi:hypothetical protein